METKKIKIVYLFRTLAIVGGAQRVIIDKMNYFAESLDYDVTILTYEQNEHPIAFPLSPKVNHIDLGVLFYKRYQYPIFKRSLLFFKNRRVFLSKFNNIICAVNPDIIICTSYSLLDVNAVVSLKHKAKRIVETHSSMHAIGKRFVTKSNFVLKLGAIIHDKLLYKCIKGADVFITLTQEDAELWKNIRKPIVIPNMLINYPEKEHYFKKKQVISAGRLTEQKGYDLLISAWEIVSKKHPDWSLKIYGAGEDQKSLEEQIISNNLSKCISINEPVKNIYTKYSESEIYVLSSRWEGFGMVLVEAMACGIPPVSFACPAGPRDIITDGVNGILVENGNVKMLADKISCLIENEELRKQMGANARVNVRRFSKEVIMSKWEDLFTSLVENEKNNLD